MSPPRPLRSIETALRLLILLSAMIAGLTGLIAGDPASARAGEPTAIAASANAATEQVHAALIARRIATAAVYATLEVGYPLPELTLAPQTHKVNERRNE